MLHHWVSDGKFYIGGFVLLTFVELVRLAINELTQYKTVYVQLTFTRPMLDTCSWMYSNSIYNVAIRTYMYVRTCTCLSR